MQIGKVGSHPLLFPSAVRAGFLSAHSLSCDMSRGDYNDVVKIRIRSHRARLKSDQGVEDCA